MAPSAAESEEAVTTGRGEHYHEELAPYEADVAEGDMELKEDAEGDEEGEGEVKAEEEEEEEEEEVDPLAETKQLIKVCILSDSRCNARVSCPVRWHVRLGRSLVSGGSFWCRA